MSQNSLEAGRALAAKLNPGMEEVLESRYGHLVSGIA